jgi:hypothetical protein
VKDREGFSKRSGNSYSSYQVKLSGERIDP